MKLIDKFRRGRLMSKLFVVMTVSIVAVCLLTSLITIRMSERLFAETFSITNGKVLNQINTGLESFNDSVVNAVITASQSGSVKTYLTGGDTNSVAMSKVYYRMAEQMKQISSNLGAYEVAVTIIGVNGRSYSTDSNYWPVSPQDLADDPLTRQAAAEPLRVLYQYDERDGKAGKERFIVATKALVDRTGGLSYGMLYIAIRESEFRRFFANFTSNGNDVLVLDPSGVVVSSNRTELIGGKSPELLRDVETLKRDQLNYLHGTAFGQDAIILANELPPYRFYLVNLIDRQYTAGQIINIRQLTLICLTIIGAALLVMFVISRRLTLSLTRLVRLMSTITKKDFRNYISVSGSYEVRELSKAFNYMLDELNDYVQQLLETQKEQRNAELAALQRQINPHFLYNTLASIKLLVQKGNKETAAETINALISLLQNTISNANETITIEQELENLKNYVFIQQVRYGDRIKVSYFVSPDCMHCQVPKLMLQPFIENAFFHAFNVKTEGTIYILISKTEHWLVCEVVDNGDGMENGGQELMLEQRTSGESVSDTSRGWRRKPAGIGIQNVNHRIKLLYGESYGVQISSVKGEGTQIRIVLPLMEEAEADGDGA